MKRAIIYTRFSPRRDEKSCESCEMQEEYCRRHASEHGLDVVAAVADKALSGGDGDRPGLIEAMATLKRGDVLLVYHPYRLARDTYLAESIRRSVSAKGATIECCTGDFEGAEDDPMTIAVRKILDVIGELERNTIRQRTSAAMKSHQRRGRRMSRHAPYGWTIDPEDGKRMTECAEERAAIGEIMAMKSGGAGAQSIARMMNAMMPHVARKGTWTAKTIWAIIRREASATRSGAA